MPRSFVGFLARRETFGSRWLQRAIFGVLILVCAVLTFFPERYRGAVTMAPSDPSTLGLSGALNQLGANNTVFGNQAAVEVTLKVADSVWVRENVIRQLDLIKRLGFKNDLQAQRWLQAQVDARSLRGSIVQMDTRQKDPQFAQDLIQAFAEAVRERLAAINRQQTAYKRQILERLVAEASTRLNRAQAAFDNFRLHNRYSDPTVSIGSISGRVPSLEAAIQAKQVQLNAARQFATDENMSVRQIVAELDALRNQLAEAKALSPEEGSSVGEAVQASTRAKELQRDLIYAQALYDNYSRFLEGTAVEDMTSMANLRVLEPPHIDTARQLNILFLALGVMLVLLAAAIEFYRMRPPLEAVRYE